MTNGLLNEKTYYIWVDEQALDFYIYFLHDFVPRVRVFAVAYYSYRIFCSLHAIVKILEDFLQIDRSTHKRWVLNGLHRIFEKILKHYCIDLPVDFPNSVPQVTSIKLISSCFEFVMIVSFYKLIPSSQMASLKARIIYLNKLPFLWLQASVES